MEFVVEEPVKTSAVQTVNGNVPVVPREPDRGGQPAILEELNVYYKAMKNFHLTDPREVMVQISAYSARLAEIRALLHRNGSVRASALRTKEVDPLMTELKFQFQIASRQVATQRNEWEMSGGGV